MSNFIDIGRSKGRNISVAHMSFSLGNEYKNVRVTCKKDNFVVNRMADTIDLPDPFSLLYIRDKNLWVGNVGVVLSALVL